jgi:hypothetical protein
MAHVPFFSLTPANAEGQIRREEQDIGVRRKDEPQTGRRVGLPMGQTLLLPRMTRPGRL